MGVKPIHTFFVRRLSVRHSRPEFGAVRRALVVSFLALAACGKRSDPGALETGASAAASKLPAAAPGGSRVQSPTAFELTTSRDGATLVWAPLGGNRPALLRVELDDTGNRRGSASVLLAASSRRGEISDVAAAPVGDRLAVAWIERSQGKASVRATWASQKARVFELGSAFFGPPTARSNVVVAARRDAALVFSRGEEIRCIEPGKHACYGFGFHELRGDTAVPTGLPLSVPVPCIDNATSLAVLPGRYHYGVCTDEGGGPVTTVFTITPEPAYARAERVLKGCEPSGTFVWDESAWLVAECQGNRRAARIGGGDDAVEYLDMRALHLDCRAGLAAVRARGFELALDEPRARLEALLPTAIAPRGSRAAFTGRTLLVASSAGTALRLARYTCTGDRWEEASVDLE